MIPDLKHILYCTQIGPNALSIFRYAYSLAEKYGAKITVLHVREVLSHTQEALVEGYSGKGRLHRVVEREESEARELLEERITEFFSREIGRASWDEVLEGIVMVEGRAPREIVKQIKAVKADMVVMGSHRAGLMDLLLGSTSQKVIQSSRVPVLVVPVLGPEEGHVSRRKK